MGLCLSLFWLHAFFLPLIVLCSPQIALSQVLPQEAPVFLQQNAPLHLRILQPPVQMNRQRLILGAARFQQIRSFIGYTLEKEHLPAVKRRVEAYLLSQKDWIDHHCQLTPAQSDRYDELISESLNNDSKRWSQGFLLPTARDLLPITFVFDGLGQKKFDAPLWHKKIDSFLTNSQQAVLNEARHEREARLRSEIRDHAYAELNGLLYFTPMQRPLVEQHLDSMISKSKTMCFSISNKKAFFPYAYTIELLAGFPHEYITPPQAAMLRLKRSNHLPSTRWSLVLTRSDSPEATNKKIDQLAERLRQELMRPVMVRFDCLIAFLDLSPADARRLEVAAKGAVHYKVNESKNSALQSYRNTEARMNNAQPGVALRYSVTFPRPGIDAVFSHPIIQEVDQSLEEEFESYFKVNAQNEHKARIAYIVSLLDRELWLTQTQREAFTELITGRMAVKPITSPDDIYEIVLIAFPLATISDQEVSEILDQSQLAGWKELQTHFQFGDDPSVDDSASLKLPRANGKFVFKVPASVTAPATIQPVEAVR